MIPVTGTKYPVLPSTNGTPIPTKFIFPQLHQCWNDATLRSGYVRVLSDCSINC